MAKYDDVRFALYDMDPDVMDIIGIFDGLKKEDGDFWNMTALDEQSRTAMEDIAGFRPGEHFNLFVDDNNPPASALVSLLKVCTIKGIAVTIHYWDGSEKKWHVQEWPAVIA